MTNATDSSWINSLDWIEGDMYMSTDQGYDYKIYDVPQEVAMEWCERAESVGKFFNQKIADDYKIERIVDML